MNLPGIGKVIVDALKEDGLKIRTLTQAGFNKEIKELSKLYSGLTEKIIGEFSALYIQDKDTILFNANTKILKEYVILHETIHSIRAQEKRLPRMKMDAPVHSSMKSAIKKASAETKTPTAHLNIFYNKAKSDIEFWREEAVADCLSIFMCTEYGVNIRRNAIDTKRIVFVPLNIKDAYKKSDKNKFISNVRKECLITLKFIMDNYVHQLFDKKLVIKNFKNFFEEEVEYCLKQIKKPTKKPQTT